MKAFGKRYSKILMLAVGFLTAWYYFCLPNALFNVPYSLILEDRNGKLLGAKIAGDEQWRFPLIDSLPEKFESALLCFEDKRFYAHRGVDLKAIARAVVQNIKSKRIVSGGSTLTMQVIRLSRGDKPRTVFQKVIEMILATRLEFKLDKDEILRTWASHAPFGGNIVGVETASWRYYGKSPDLLTWAESATLAVLPNSPALIHPGRNRDQLMEKRNRLLTRMLENEIIDSLTYGLAILEKIPNKPSPLPRLTPHLIEWANQGRSVNDYRIKTSLVYDYQKLSIETIDFYQRIFSQNGVHNAAALIIDTQSGEIISYVGNTANGPEADVDMIKAFRSSGSILKPFLFALQIDEGQNLSTSLVADVPVQINGYIPDNFDRSYSGALPASEALAKSLNIPAVLSLQDYGIEKFRRKLNSMGFHSIQFSSEHYGLPLILGGGEVSLFDLGSAYASMGRILGNFYNHSGKYVSSDFRKASISKNQFPEEKNTEWAYEHFSAGAIWETFEAMKTVIRPGVEGDWQRFQSSQEIAWKTGTSFGHRDAWAVGVNPKYTVAVWVGNADGEGKTGNTGISAAGPILFNIFNFLPSSEWFEKPHDEMTDFVICSKSGYISGIFCESSDTLSMPRAGLKSPSCPYHQIIHLDKKEEYRVNSSCVRTDDMVERKWFSLPTKEAHYYSKHHPDYQSIPPYMESCNHDEGKAHAMELIYPFKNNEIFIPTDLDGQKGEVVFKAAHAKPGKVIYWHLDDEYLGATDLFHNISISAEPGNHRLVLVDNDGERLEQTITFID